VSSTVGPKPPKMEAVRLVAGTASRIAVQVCCRMQARIAEESEEEFPQPRMPATAFQPLSAVA